MLVLRSSATDWANLFTEVCSDNISFDESSGSQLTVYGRTNMKLNIVFATVKMVKKVTQVYYLKVFKVSNIWLPQKTNWNTDRTRHSRRMKNIAFSRIWAEYGDSENARKCDVLHSFRVSGPISLCFCGNHIIQILKAPK